MATTLAVLTVLTTACGKAANQPAPVSTIDYPDHQLGQEAVTEIYWSMDYYYRTTPEFPSLLLSAALAAYEDGWDTRLLDEADGICRMLDEGVTARVVVKDWFHLGTPDLEEAEATGQIAFTTNDAYAWAFLTELAIHWVCPYHKSQLSDMYEDARAEGWYY